MIDIQMDKGLFLVKGQTIVPSDSPEFTPLQKEAAKKGTIAYDILTKHNTLSTHENLSIKFDAMASHDITYVGIIQTARVSGLEKFPIPYVLTNCHNSLSAVGGTINEDDHAFGLSSAVKYGGIYVPPHQAVIHQYMREMMAGCGKMILGSDSHTRYGALGTMAVGEGGPELVKQLLGKTWDIKYPEVIAIYLEGTPAPGVGPQDVALAIIGAVFKQGYVKNKVMEFVGPGISSLSMDYRIGIDVMTTETTCLTSIWRTDEATKAYLANHGRENDYKEINPDDLAYYDGLIKVDLSTIEPMIALPFHPSNTYTLKELKQNAQDIFAQIESDARKNFNRPDLNLGLLDKIQDGKILVDQGEIAGCAGGTFENLTEAASILRNGSIGNGNFNLSAYPSSQPVNLELLKTGSTEALMSAGVIMRTAFCGPCFGAGDVPFDKGFSIRHTTRNFPNREGSIPKDNQIASVALMDARSIAATAAAGGILTSATEINYDNTIPAYHFDPSIYKKRVYSCPGCGKPEKSLKIGPNIKDWPKMIPMTDNLLLSFSAVINDPVTTTDELIPSGETSSYRSNPLRLAEFTLSRRVPSYVKRAKKLYTEEINRRKFVENSVKPAISKETQGVLDLLKENKLIASRELLLKNTSLGSIIYAVKPGDGSAREQAASCQKVLGGWANLTTDYATKRYRSNVVNWGMIPFTQTEELDIKDDDYLFLPGIKKALQMNNEDITAYLISENQVKATTFKLPAITEEERKIILSGCLMNYYAETK